MSEESPNTPMSGPEVLALFESELKSDSPDTRVECIRNLDVIAFALGPEAALSKLIPVVAECIRGDVRDNDDEILLAFSKYLPSLLPVLPGQGGLVAVIGLLELLANQDETVIREAAVSSLGEIAKGNPAAGKDVCFPALMRLFRADWFSSKISACGLAHFVYPCISAENKAQIRAFFLQCATDEMPMIKRAAACHMKDIVTVIEKENLIKEFIPVYHVLSKDDTQESVRSSCVNATVSLCSGGIFNEAESNEYLVETMAELATDNSWRVRLAVAKVYDTFCRSIGGNSVKAHLLRPLMNMILRDQEPDVRKAAVIALQPICTLLTDDDITMSIVPLLPLVSKDQVQAVRAALSESISGLALTLSRPMVEQHIVPLLMDLVKDEHPSIRFSATASIGNICQVLNYPEGANNKLIAQFIALLHSLSQDTNWRTRVAVLEQVPILSKLYGQELFESKLENLFLAFFGDSVYAIRESLTKQIGVLASILGEDWTVHHLLPKVLSLYSESSSYSSRIAILQALPKMTSVMQSQQAIQSLVLPTLERGCADPVANVRFTACRVVAEMQGSIGHLFDQKVSPLLNDQDIDVRFFADRVVSNLIST